MRTRSPSIASYDANAPRLAENWRTLDPLAVHAPVLHLLPNLPVRILDIGAGAGGDAGWFSSQGHHIVAVEPADGLRLAGMRDHPSPRIEWIDDSLPELVTLAGRSEAFDLVMLTAVWAHLDHDQRARAMPNIARLMRHGGRLIMSIRHGWTPPDRPTWDARPDDTIRFAEAEGLVLIFRATNESVQAVNRANGVSWTRLAFDKL